MGIVTRIKWTGQWQRLVCLFLDLYVICGIISVAITLIMLAFSPRPIEKSLIYLLASFFLWPVWPYGMLWSDSTSTPDFV